LSFPVAAHKKVAVRLLRALAVPLGHHARRFRPDTKLEEQITWAEGSATVDFILAVEDGIGEGAGWLSDDLERMTFRELVESVCDRKQKAI
jgi:hypothetical protein